MKKLQNCWESFSNEMASKDSLQKDMLQSIFRQVLIYCISSLKKLGCYEQLEVSQVELSREFNFLVERHFSKHHDAKFMPLN